MIHIPPSPRLYKCFLVGFNQNMVKQRELEENSGAQVIEEKSEEAKLDPWSLFMNAMKAPMTRDRYQIRVAKFFDFNGIGDEDNTLEEKARIFADRGKEDTDWAFGNILKFIHLQKERVDRKEITGATVRLILH